MHRSILSLIATLILSASLFAQQAVTFYVQCGEQGILDAPYSIFVNVKNPSADPLGPQTITVTVEIPNRASSEFVTGLIAMALSDLLEPPYDTVDTGEVVDNWTNPDKPANDTDKLKGHRLLLPKGVEIVGDIGLKREGNDGDGGQLQVCVD